MKLFLCMVYTELFTNLSLCHWLILVFSSRFYFQYIIALISNQVLSSLALHGQFFPKYSQWTPIAHPWRRYKMSSISSKSVPCSTCHFSAICTILLYWLLLQWDSIHTTVMFSNKYFFIYFLLTHVLSFLWLILHQPLNDWVIFCFKMWFYFLILFSISAIFLYENGSIQWMFSQHCGCYW